LGGGSALANRQGFFRRCGGGGGQIPNRGTGRVNATLPGAMGAPALGVPALGVPAMGSPRFQ
jgi:hypothetical protein